MLYYSKDFLFFSQYEWRLDSPFYNTLKNEQNFFKLRFLTYQGLVQFFWSLSIDVSELIFFLFAKDGLALLSFAPYWIEFLNSKKEMNVWVSALMRLWENTKSFFIFVWSWGRARIFSILLMSEKNQTIFKTCNM